MNHLMKKFGVGLTISERTTLVIMVWASSPRDAVVSAIDALHYTHPEHRRLVSKAAHIERLGYSNVIIKQQLNAPLKDVPLN